MKTRKRVSLTTIALVATLAWTGSALAAGPFVHDSSTGVARDGSGNCLFNGHGDRAKAAKAGCPGAMVRTTYDVSAFFDTDTDSATLKPEAKKALDKLVASLGDPAAVKRVRVTGHTDSVGSDAYNQTLSERRAAAVKSYLAGKGIPEGRIVASGMGESRPIADNGTAAGRAKNRRVEVDIIN